MDASDIDKGEETGSELIVMHSNSSELLELEEEGFHKMAFLVEPPIDDPRVGIIRLGRDAEIRIVVGDKLTKLPLAIISVSEDCGTFLVNPAEQFFSDSGAIGVAGSQHDLGGIAQGVYYGMCIPRPRRDRYQQQPNGERYPSDCRRPEENGSSAIPRPALMPAW